MTDLVNGGSLMPPEDPEAMPGIKPYRNNIEDIIEHVEDSNSFEELARFRINTLRVMVECLNELKVAVDKRLVEIGGTYEDKKYLVTIGKEKKVKVPTKQIFDQVVKKDPGSLLSLLSSSNAFKPGAYQKFCEKHGLKSELIISFPDVVKVKEYNKDFLTEV